MYRRSTAGIKRECKTGVEKYLKDISEYDNIFVCGPCWWGTYPVAVFTQLERLDFTGKAEIIKPMEIKFDSQGGPVLQTAEDKINDWIAEVKRSL